MYAADTDSTIWLAALRSPDASTRDQAIGDLHSLLVRAARFRLCRPGAAVDDRLAEMAADDALATLLAALDGFRGASRFTTWAAKFAVVEAGSFAHHDGRRRHPGLVP